MSTLWVPAGVRVVNLRGRRRLPEQARAIDPPGVTLEGPTSVPIRSNGRPIEEPLGEEIEFETEEL